MHIETGEIVRVLFKKWAYRTLSRCLEAKYGGTTAQLGIAALIKYKVCC